MERIEDRAVSEVLGLILVFGILITLLGVYQAFMVPTANEEIEFKHNQQLQGEMIDLRNAILTQQSSDSPTSKTVNLGTEYPARMLALNPGAPQGTLETGEADDITLSGFEGVNEDVKAYLNGSDQHFTTRHLQYKPGYNEFGVAPTTTIEHSVVYNTFNDGGELVMSDQRLIQGDRIQLGAFSGEERYQGPEASVDLNPVSTGMNTVQVEVEDGYIEVPTQLSNETWVEMLATQDRVDHNNISKDDGIISIPLEDGIYNLQMANIGIGSDQDPVHPEYLYKESGDRQTIQQHEQSSVIVEVRDEYNNPVSGVDVEFSPGAGISASDDANLTTNENGQAEFFFTSPNNNSGTINASLPEYNDVENVTFTINVGDLDLGSQGELNPAGIIDVERHGWDGDETYKIDFVSAEEESIDLVEGRFNLDFTAGASGNEYDIESIELSTTEGQSGDLEVGDAASEFEDELEIHEDGTTVTVELTGDTQQGSNNDYIFVITLITEHNDRIQYMFGGAVEYED